MLEKLTLKNFKNHENFTCTFTNGLNVIVGSGDKGKSNIIKAFSWFSGHRNFKNIFKHGTEKTEVIAVIDGVTCKRVKTPKSNIVYIEDKKYEKVGKDGCPELDKLLNLGDINFQYQFDNEFFLSLTPGNAAKQLNEIADLSCMDELLSHIKSDLRDALKTKSEQEEIFKATELRFNAFLRTKDINTVYQSLKQLNVVIEQLQGNINDVSELLKQLKETRDIKEPPKLDKIEKLANEFNLIVNQENLLVELLSEYGTLKIPQNICIDHLRFSDVGDIIKQIEFIDNCKLEYKNINNSIKDLDKEIDSITEEYDRIKPDSCPLCGKDW